MSEDHPWQENTELNPFWKHRYAVEVKFKDGAVRRFGCASCQRREMPNVVEWRPAPAVKREPI